MTLRFLPGLLMTVVLAGGAHAQTGASKSPGADVSAIVNPLFSNYCVSCHNQSRKSANLSLDDLNAGNVSQNPAVWEKILMRLRTRRDPAMGAPRPDERTYLSTISALESALDHAYLANVPNPANRIDDAALAVRMAKFIWNDRPDTLLLEAAKKGGLRKPQEIDGQVRRMLQDPKAESLVRGFFERWASLDVLDKSQNADESLRRDFATETRLFIANQLREDNNASDLWTANYTFLNDRLARHYGIPGAFGSEFRRFTYTDDRRAGLLGHGSFLTVTSAKDRTSPVSRGKVILMTFLGLEPPPLLPNVPPLKPDDNRPMRVRMQEHVSNPVCASCHVTFEPMGYALENFDLLGRWRSMDAGETLDVSGKFVDGTTFNGPAELRAGLLKYRAAYYSSITQKLLAYALGREGKAWSVRPYEMPAVRSIMREAAARDYRWSSIVSGIVKSAPFQAKID